MPAKDTGAHDVPNPGVDSANPRTWSAARVSACSSAYFVSMLSILRASYWRLRELARKYDVNGGAPKPDLIKKLARIQGLVLPHLKEACRALHGPELIPCCCRSWRRSGSHDPRPSLRCGSCLSRLDPCLRFI